MKNSTCLPRQEAALWPSRGKGERHVVSIVTVLKRHVLSEHAQAPFAVKMSAVSC